MGFFTILKQLLYIIGVYGGGLYNTEISDIILHEHVVRLADIYWLDHNIYHLEEEDIRVA